MNDQPVCQAAKTLPQSTCEWKSCAVPAEKMPVIDGYKLKKKTSGSLHVDRYKLKDREKRYLLKARMASKKEFESVFMLEKHPFHILLFIRILGRCMEITRKLLVHDIIYAFVN